MFLLGNVALAILAVVASLLNEDVLRHKMWRWFAVVPSKKNRKRHALGFVGTVVFALIPMGQQMLEAHPCEAWGWWTAALCCATYSFWRLMPLTRWGRTLVVVAIFGSFAFIARTSIYDETRLNFFFVHPGIYVPFIKADGPSAWILIITGRNTRQPLINVRMELTDAAMLRAAASEADINKREALMRAAIGFRTYPEIGPTFHDQIEVVPLDINNQEYIIDASYRIGQETFWSRQDIRIVNVGPRISVLNSATVIPRFQDAITVTNQGGTALMKCIDRDFPHDAVWFEGQVCYPGPNFGPVPRSLCQRCFARGFEFVPAS